MRYIIGLLIAIGLVIALIFVIASGGNDAPSKVPSTEKPLQDYADTSATARMTIAGPIVANEEYRETRVSVDRDNVVIENITGYQGTVTSSDTSANTREAYVAFLKAIDRTGFTEGNTDKALSDERGYCPLGKRYIFELIQDGKTLQRFWTTNCNTTETFLGNISQTSTLFIRQAPGYNSLLNRGEALSIY